MKQKRYWQNYTMWGISLLLSVPIATMPAVAQSTSQSSQSPTTQPSDTVRQVSNNSNNPQLVQATNRCRQVIARYGLYVRSGPSVYNEAIEILDYGRNVTVEPGSTGLWTPISAPLQGYVWTDWLAPCRS